jgi:hypothetical protein
MTDEILPRPIAANGDFDRVFRREKGTQLSQQEQVFPENVQDGQ